VWVTSSAAKALTPTAIALGNFDGLHRGHQRVIEPILDRVRSEERTEHTYATVVTFNPHPQEFFTGQRRALLTPLNEKVQQLLRLGVEQLVLLPFDRALAALKPQEFVERILVQQLRSERISVGEDFRFGWQRSGTATDLQAIAGNFGIPVTIVSLYTCEGERISSSSIRQALEQGNLQRAKTLLGRPYTLTGSVIKGQQLGRTIGFPTANLQMPPEKFLPQQGVYAVRVFIEEGWEKTDSLPGVMNIGSRPTVNGIYPSVEVHLLDWFEDLYGKTLTVQLQKFLRSEQKFASLEALKAQIQTDCAIARSVLSLEL
jgi:riboflavin kinase/FMN adenylyltransferase